MVKNLEFVVLILLVCIGSICSIIMNQNDVLGEILEQGQSLVKKGGKAVKSSVSDTVKAAAGQVTGDNGSQDNSGQSQDVQTGVDTVNKAETEELVKGLYAKSKPGNQTAQTPQSVKEADDKQKLERLRQELHGQYYQKLVNRPKPKEERPAEKVEREDKQKMADLQEKEAKKPAPLAVQRAQQSTEKYRGPSG